MQPIFCSFASGLPYRKTVKLHFCRISTIDLLVSIYENVSFRLFSSFLTAGNKSKCGTLQRLTHPQQSTDEPIFRPVSPPKRQAMQGKSFVLSPISTQTSSHLRKHRTSVPSRLQKLPGDPQPQPQPHPSRSQATPSHTSIRPQTHPSLRTHTPSSPQPHPQPNPQTLPQPQPHPRCALRPSPATPPTPPSSAPHTPSPPQSRMQFPNRSDSATQSDTNKQASQGELHAKLQHLRPLAGPVATPHGGHRAQAATHPDR